MYGVKYKVPFKTISDRDSVVILEERGYTGSVIELIAGGTPFIINTDQSDLLTPIRSSTATLTVVGSEYLQDLYANDPQGIRVKYEVDGEVKWLGYLLPDTFSQDFSSSEFEYEMELVAALSTLKYREYDLTDDFVTFRQIIEKAVEYSGYEAVYLTNSVRTETGKFYDLKISSANFFDELGEASTYYEVLEEIAKYLGCCFVPYEDDLYLLDYQAIRSGYNSYTRIVGSSVSNVTLSDAKVVDNYKGTGAKISRIAGKNKATVNCSLYEIENIVPVIEDNLSNTGSSNLTFGSKMADKKAVYHYLVAVPAHISGDKLQVPPRAIDVPRSSFNYTARYTEDAVPNKLNFTPELWVTHYINKDGARLTPNDIIMSIKSENELFIHNSVFFSFSCSIMTGVEGTKVSGRDGLIMLEPWGEAPYDTTKHLPLKLRIGEYYYNGSAWTKTETKFDSFFFIKKDEKEHGRFITTRDDNDYTLGIGDLSGTIIRPPSQTIVGEMELTIYAPNIFIYNFKYSFIKDIKLDYAVQDIEGVYKPDKDKEDAIYESIPNETYVEEADEIDLKICTNTDGKLAFSSVLERDSFLSEISTDVFGTGIAEEILLQRVVSLFSKPRFNINPTLENNAKPYTLFTEPHLSKTFLLAGGEIDAKRESATYNLIEI